MFKIFGLSLAFQDNLKLILKFTDIPKVHSNQQTFRIKSTKSTIIYTKILRI